MNKILSISLMFCSALFFGCDTTDAEDNSWYEYEKTLTSIQLAEELNLARSWGDESYCFNTCRTLTVPTSADDSAQWSKVSLCRIDVCHSTDLCIKNVNGLIDRTSECNESYQPATNNKSNETIEPEEMADDVPSEDVLEIIEESSSSEIESSSSANTETEVESDLSITDVTPSLEN